MTKHNELYWVFDADSYVDFFIFIFVTLPIFLTTSNKLARKIKST